MSTLAERLKKYSKVLSKEIGYTVKVEQLIGDDAEERLVAILDPAAYMMFVPATSQDMLFSDRYGRRWRRAKAQ